MKAQTKRFLLTTLALVLVAAISIGGTIAFLRTEEQTVSNVFTIGDDITIKLTEKAGVIRNGQSKDVVTSEDVSNNFVENDYGKILPGDYLEKKVNVANTGSVAAYVRVTVTLNNAAAIDKAIKGTYAGGVNGYGYSSAAVEAMYDYIFDGWNINSSFKVDSVKNGVLPTKTVKDTVKDTYTITYYLYLEAEAEDGSNADRTNTTLFNGINVPQEFTYKQLEMFRDFKIDVTASAIQADNIDGTNNLGTEAHAEAAFAYLAEIESKEYPDNNLVGAPDADTWDGKVDTSWYDDTKTEFVIDTAEQLAGLAELVDGGNTFDGKTVKLKMDIDLYKAGADGDPVSFEPIGSLSDNKAFEGTFDGQGHTVYNMYQNGWALANGYWDGPEYGMGLFSLVENATVKNVNFDASSLPTEANIIGVVAGGAANCVFENINVTGAYLGNHSWYSGGLVGWAEGDVKLINCDIDETSVVSSQWGDFNNANGGLIGGIDSASTIFIKDCDVACVIDAYNDVTSAYEWYSYRNCGMLIGDTGQKDDPDGDDVGNAIAPNVTCENVTVTYGEWANYHYCQFNSSGYPFCRVEAGESTGAYGNARVGEYTDANGNKVVDDNHVHNPGEKHNELIVFNQLYGGATGDRYCTYGTATHDGVTVIKSVTSFAEFKAAIADGAKDVKAVGVEFSEKLSLGSSVNAIFEDCTFTGNNAWGYVNNATFVGCTFDSGSENAAIHFDRLYGELVMTNCYFKSGKVQIGTDGDSNAVFNNCVFGETTTTSIWAEKGMRFYCPTVFNECEFNNRVVLAGGNGLELTFNYCTMNGGKPVYYVDNTDGIIRGGNIPAVTIN